MGSLPPLTQRGWSLAGLIRRHATERGQRPMLTYGDRVMTYAEMHARSSLVARALAAEGVRSQDHVGFIDKNGPEYFEVLFGGGKLNAINIAVNWRLTPAEMAYIVNDAEIGVLVVGSDFTSHLNEIASLRAIRKIVVIGEHPGYESYERWIGRQRAEDRWCCRAPGQSRHRFGSRGRRCSPLHRAYPCTGY